MATEMRLTTRSAVGYLNGGSCLLHPSFVWLPVYTATPTTHSHLRTCVDCGRNCSELSPSRCTCSAVGPDSMLSVESKT